MIEARYQGKTNPRWLRPKSYPENPRAWLGPKAALRVERMGGYCKSAKHFRVSLLTFGTLPGMNIRTSCDPVKTRLLRSLANEQ